MSENITTPNKPSDVVRKRVTTGSVGAATSVNVTVTFDEPFDDTNYTAVPTIEEASMDLRCDGIVSRTATQVVVRIRNTDALNAATGTVHVIAIAD